MLKPMCRHKGFALVLFLTAVLSAVCFAADTGDDRVQAEAERIGGTFVGERGTTVLLAKPEDVPGWVMSVTEPEATPVTIVLDGTPERLKPRSIDFTLPFGGNAMSVLADGNRLYAKGHLGGETVECLRDDRGARTAIGGNVSGEAPTQAEMESSLMLEEVANRWKIMQQLEIRVADDELVFHDSGLEGDTPRRFRRAEELSKEDKELIEQKLSARAEILRESELFATRGQKSEEER